MDLRVGKSAGGRVGVGAGLGWASRRICGLADGRD